MKKILLIEDDKDLRTLWVVLFKSYGYEVESFSSSSEFLSRADLIRQCDLIITDYHVDELTGLQIAETAQEVFPNKPFFFFTGSGDDDVISRIKSQPNSQLFIKPVQTNKIKRALEKLFSE